MAVIASTAIGTGFLLIVAGYIVSAAWIRRAHRNARAAPAPGAAEPEPYELALLAGGRWRVGQVALTDAYLEGSVRVERRSGFLRRALIRSAPGALDGSAGRHPVLASALRRALNDAAEPVTMPAERLVAAAGMAAWIANTLPRLRADGLLLTPRQVGTAQSLRRAASRLHNSAVLPMAVLVAAPTAFTAPMLFGSLQENAALSPAGFFLGALGPPAVLVVVYRRFGTPAVVAVLAALSCAIVAVAPFMLWVVALCGVWLGAYGVYAATNRFCGSRTPAGDAVVAAARSSLSAAGGSDRELVLRAVALYGISGLRRPDQLDITFSVTASAEGSFPGLSEFAEQCGGLDAPSSGSSGDGGPGGSFGADGGPSGFDSAGGGAGHGGGGDGGGGSGGGGGIGGGGGGGGDG